MSRQSWLDRVMEKTVVPSFTSIGPRVRRRLDDWSALESLDLDGKTVVITGGTSGIGEKGAELIARLGAELVIVARSPDKTDRVVEALKAASGNDRISHVIADLGERGDVESCIDTLLERHETIDVLIHNAGALFNERKRADNGNDLAVELMVVTPFLLTGRLLPALRRASPGRVITMSSGGMYTEPLRVDDLEMSDEAYQGAKQYARAKRAQVVLNELWAARIPHDEVVFHSLHPGWVDTPGIQDALPGFSKLLSPLGLLRNAREGADTMVWLAAADEAVRRSGEFWLDRRPRSTHMMRSTHEADTEAKRQALWNWCEAQSGWRFEG